MNEGGKDVQKLYTSVAREETNQQDTSMTLDKINEVSRVSSPEKPVTFGEVGGTGTSVSNPRQQRSPPVPS